jgi:hypothetical protein
MEMESMKKITLNEEICVFYVKAKSFPDGIFDAHNKIRALVAQSPMRRYFGVSRPEEEEDGNIGYKAAAEELEMEEAKKYNCPRLTIKRGKYISLLVKNYTRDPQSIGKAFECLLDYPNLDPQGYCVEQYMDNNDVLCMIRLDE